MFQIGASPDVSMTDDDVVPDRQHLKPGPGFMRQPFKIYENLRSAVSGYRGQASRGVYQVMMMIMMIIMMMMMMMMMMMSPGYISGVYQVFHKTHEILEWEINRTRKTRKLQLYLWKPSIYAIYV